MKALLWPLSWRLAWFILGWVLSAKLPAVELPGPLVEPAWVANHLGSVVLLDIRTRPDEFTRTGHIPGAVPLDWSQVQAEREEGGQRMIGLVPSRTDFQSLMQKKGVSRSSVVVITSPGKTAVDATRMARLYWTLKYYGHDPVTVLNGGTAQWTAQGGALDFVKTTRAEGDFIARAGRAELIASTQEVAAAIGSPETQLVDARDLAYYLGLSRTASVSKAGHIPGAKLFPYRLAIRSDPARFRSIDELRSLAGVFHIDLERPIIAYCNTGVLSAADWFIFHELLGNDRARLYDGSMHAWTRTGRPVETLKLNLD